MKLNITKLFAISALSFSFLSSAQAIANDVNEASVFEKATTYQSSFEPVDVIVKSISTTTTINPRNGYRTKNVSSKIIKHVQLSQKNASLFGVNSYGENYLLLKIDGYFNDITLKLGQGNTSNYDPHFLIYMGRALELGALQRITLLNDKTIHSITLRSGTEIDARGMLKYEEAVAIYEEIKAFEDKVKEETAGLYGPRN